MCDHQCRAVFGNGVERILDVFFGLAVERAGRFIEHQDRRTFQDCAGNGNALLFSAR